VDITGFIGVIQSFFFQTCNSFRVGLDEGEEVQSASRSIIDFPSSFSLATNNGLEIKQCNSALNDYSAQILSVDI